MLKSPWEVLKCGCKILEMFGSLGPFVGIAQFVKLEVENWVCFWHYNDISCMHVLYNNYVVLFTLVNLQSQCTGQASEPVNIFLGKVLKKSLNWWMTKEGESYISVSP